MEEFVIERASVRDAEEIFALYHALIAAPCSTWSEDYPGRELVEEEAARGWTMVMRNASGRIAAAIALLPGEEEPEFDGIAPWYPDVKKWACPARLGVAMAYQGRGLAGRMLQGAMDAARADGCEAVRFLVAKSNPIAQRAYSRLGFDICGEHEMWGHLWLCYQKRL